MPDYLSVLQCEVRQTTYPKFHEDASPEQEQANKAVKSVTVELTETANTLLNDITMAENNYIQAKYADFSVEEMNQYLALRDKIKKNTQKIL